MKKSIVCEKMRKGEVILSAKMNFMNPNQAISGTPKCGMR